MNRRDFTRGLASLGLTPAMPLPNLAGGSASTVVASASAEKMYFMGWYTARLNKTCSPDLLARELNLNADVAHKIFTKLVNTQTVSAPNALGLSRTLDPLAQSFGRVTGSFAKQMVSEPSVAGQGEPLVDAKQYAFEAEDAEDLDVTRTVSDIEDVEDVFDEELDVSDQKDMSTDQLS